MSNPFYEYMEFVDWEKVNRNFGDANEAVKTLKEDFAMYEEVMDADGKTEIVWHFKKWLKSKNITASQLDAVLDKIRDNLKDHG